MPGRIEPYRIEVATEELADLIAELSASTATGAAQGRGAPVYGAPLERGGGCVNAEICRQKSQPIPVARTSMLVLDLRVHISAIAWRHRSENGNQGVLHSRSSRGRRACR